MNASHLRHLLKLLNFCKNQSLQGCGNLAGALQEERNTLKKKLFYSFEAFVKTPELLQESKPTRL